MESGDFLHCGIPLQGGELGHGLVASKLSHIGLFFFLFIMILFLPATTQSNTAWGYFNDVLSLKKRMVVIFLPTKILLCFAKYNGYLHF
jgi:hypothetical protein